MECYDKAKEIIEINLEGLKLLADALLEHETLITEEIEDILGPRPQLPTKPLMSTTPR